MRPVRPSFRCRGGFTSLEILVAATVGLVLTGAALALLSVGNRAVLTLAARQAEWHHARAAAAIWASEWRGAGYDPTGSAGAGIGRFASDTLEFSADWNGDGKLLPTSSNPNERLAYASTPDAWKRGVNGGPRLVLARPESVRFVFRDDDGSVVTPGTSPERIRRIEVLGRLRAWGPAAALEMKWTATRRGGNP